MAKRAERQRHPKGILSRLLGALPAILCIAAVQGCLESSDVIATEAPSSPTAGKADATDRCAPEDEPSCVSACDSGAWTATACVATGWKCWEGVNIDHCPDYGDYCTPESPCGAGYTCVKSVTYPVPVDDEPGICRKGAITRRPEVEACRPDGILDAATFFTTQSENTGKIVKIAGELKVRWTCSNNVCSDENPCCNTCLGNYMVELRHPDNVKQWVDIFIDVGAPGCSGTTCDTSCGPLQPGDTYTVWGVLDSCQGLHRCTMLAMGSCPY